MRVTLSDLWPVTIDDGEDGFLRVRARLARTGIQIYNRDEIPGGTRQPMRVYRPAEEVFSTEALASLALVPVTIGHPMEFVTANDPSEVVGYTGDTITQDGDYVAANIIITHPRGRAVIDRGVKELSVGYSSEIEIASGLTPDGEPFDAVMRNIRANHVAIVERGRCGAGCRIGDGEPVCMDCSAEKVRTMAKELASITIDGVTVENLDEAQRILARKDEQLRATRQKLIDLEKDIEKAAERHTNALKARDAEIADLKKAMSEEAVEAEAQRYVATIAAVRAILPQGYDYKGKGRSQIMRDALVRMTGDPKIVQDKSKVEIEAMFDLAMRRPQVGEASVGGLYAPTHMGDRSHDYRRNLEASYLTPATKQ